MGNEQPVVEFVQECFRERTEALRRRLEVHGVFRQRFYHPDCMFDSRRGVIEMSEGEKIVEVLQTDTGANVVTTGDTGYRSRYRIYKSGGAWMVHEVDYECALCRLKKLSVAGADMKCLYCDGTGWVGWKRRRAMNQQSRKRPGDIVTKEELNGQYFRDADLEDFMAEHFCERARLRRKELEILENYTRQFYDPDFDSKRWGPYGEQSDSETILGVELVNTGPRVITSGMSMIRLRYDLRSSGNSWLIWNVNTECILCCKEGWKKDCDLCGGSIWWLKRGATPGCEASGDSPPSDYPRWKA